MTQTRLRTASRRNRLLRWGAALAVGVAATAAVAAPAAAAPTSVDSGWLDWGFKASFRAYVSTGNGTPPMSASDGATINADGSFHFPVTSGSYDPDGATEIHYGGTVVFSYPAHFFTITLANPTVVIDGATRVLKADVDLVVTSDDFTPVHVVQADIATLGTGSPSVDGGTATWTALSATLTATGASAFAGFYTEGTALDPVTTSVTTAGGGGDEPQEPGSGSAGQELAVEVPAGPLTLAVDGTSVTLTGASIGGSATGTLNAATVSDLRGTNAGWSLVGQVEDFTGSAGTIPAANLGWSPTATGAPGSGTVTAGGAVTGLGSARTLCSGATGASAGIFTCGAGLTLAIPPTAAPGSYTATLTLTLS